MATAKQGDGTLGGSSGSHLSLFPCQCPCITRRLFRCFIPHTARDGRYRLARPATSSRRCLLHRNDAACYTATTPPVLFSSAWFGVVHRVPPPGSSDSDALPPRDSHLTALVCLWRAAFCKGGGWSAVFDGVAGLPALSSLCEMEACGKVRRGERDAVNWCLRLPVEILAGAARLFHRSASKLPAMNLTYWAQQELGPDEATALGEALPALTVLKQLALQGNKLGPEGGRALGAGLARHTALQNLELPKQTSRPAALLELPLVWPCGPAWPCCSESLP